MYFINGISAYLYHVINDIALQDISTAISVIYFSFSVFANGCITTDTPRVDKWRRALQTQNVTVD